MVEWNELVRVIDNTLEVREHWEDKSYNDFVSAVYNHTFLDRAGKLQFYDLNTGNYVILRGELTGGYPALVCSQHLAIEKDLIAKGFLNSLEGEVALNAGSLSPGWGPYTSNPFIWLKDTSYPTLEIRKVVTAGQGDADKLNPINYIWGWGNLEMGNLKPHGSITSYTSGPGYFSYYGGGGGGANGGIYLDQYGSVRFNGTSTSVFWKVLTQNGNEVIAVPNGTGSSVAIWLSCNMNPNGAGVLGCGSGSSYWSGVVTNTIYRRNESSFDALDDLSLAKNYKTKNVIEDGIEKEVVDLESLPHLRADPSKTDPEITKFWDESKVSGFLLGCVKALVQRVEALENQLKQEQPSLNKGSH